MPFFLCWGSFLNAIAYRLVSSNISFFHPRSLCPHCKTQLAWFDTIPLLSWLLLRGACRTCKAPISWLYPAIEALSAISFYYLVERVPTEFFPAYMLFFSALIVSIRTDIETLLISRVVSLWLVPMGILLSFLGWLPLSLQQSVVGTASGYASLFLVAQCYYFIAQRNGMGQGDIDLLALIGSFTGFFGWWVALLIGSCLGSLFGLSTLALGHRHGSNSIATVKLPFGPFLAIGSMLYVLFQKQILHFFLYGM